MPKKELTDIFPRDSAAEITELPAIGKALLITELVEKVIESLDCKDSLHLSTTTDQWLESVSAEEALLIIEAIASMIRSDIA